MMDRKNILKILALLIGANVLIRLVNGSYGSSGSILNWVIYHLEILPGIAIGLSFHEFGHAWMSDRLGDPIPRIQGRVSLNPLHHVDWIGFLCLLFAGFGWGKPVQIDSRYYKKPRRDELLVSFAGVVMNLLLAIVFAFVMRLLLHSPLATMTTEDSLRGTLVWVLFRIVLYTVQINVVLMVFNLIPLPPLDGFGVVTQCFNLRRTTWYATVYQYGPLLLVVLILFGGLDFILGPCTNAMMGLLQTLMMH